MERKSLNPRDVNSFSTSIVNFGFGGEDRESWICRCLNWIGNDWDLDLRSTVSSTEMFDWNDEELADIIWGEARENGDHIVPLRKEGGEQPPVICGAQGKKLWTIEDSSVKLEEQKQSGHTDDLSISKFDNGSYFNTDGFSDPGFEVDTWTNLPLHSAACSKEYDDTNTQDSMGIEASDVLIEIPKLDADGVDTTQLGNDPQFFGIGHEEKEHGDFLDYSWDNIGTFDDLDRIFRNDDPIFEHESIGKGNEPWSSSADLVVIPTESFPISAGSPSSGSGVLRNTSEQYEMNSEFMQHDSKCLATGYGRAGDPDIHFLKHVDPTKDKASRTGCSTVVIPVAELTGGESKPLLEKTDTEMIEKMELQTAVKNSACQNSSASVNKVKGQSKTLKCPKKEESEMKLTPDLCGYWSSEVNRFHQFANQFATSSVQTFPSSTLSPHSKLSGPHSLIPFQNPYPYVPTVFGNPKCHYSVMPVSSRVNSERDKDSSLISAYGPVSENHVNPLKKIPDVLSSPLTMTPQEKIEKLRRRQQIQAMRAIQEQQQQLGHRVSSPDCSDVQKCSQENQTPDTGGSHFGIEENLNVPASMESSTPVEHDDSNTIAMLTDDCSLEERVFDQLQDVIKKLDIRIRLCIRDSLLRLAQSAAQRNNSNDPSGTNNSGDKNEIIIKEEAEGYSRSSRASDAEKGTNAIDRTVAHLLFHSPSESSTKPHKDGELTKSQVSAKPICKPNKESLTDNPKDKESGSNPPWMETETYNMKQLQSSSYMNTPKKTSALVNQEMHGS